MKYNTDEIFIGRKFNVLKYPGIHEPDICKARITGIYNIAGRISIDYRVGILNPPNYIWLEDLLEVSDLLN